MFFKNSFSTAVIFGELVNILHLFTDVAWRQNVSSLAENVRLSYGMGVVLTLGGIARLELNYCVPLRTQPKDRYALNQLVSFYSVFGISIQSLIAISQSINEDLTSGSSPEVDAMDVPS